MAQIFSIILLELNMQSMLIKQSNRMKKKKLRENTNHMNFEKYEHEKFSSIIQI